MGDADATVDFGEFLVLSLLKSGSLDNEKINEIKSRFKELDVHGDGEIDLHEMRAMACFEKYDVDQSGQLTEQEVELLVRDQQLPRSVSVAAIKKNCGLSVSRKEFLAIWRSNRPEREEEREGRRKQEREEAHLVEQLSKQLEAQREQYEQEVAMLQLEFQRQLEIHSRSLAGTMGLADLPTLESDDARAVQHFGANPVRAGI